MRARYVLIHGPHFEETWMTRIPRIHANFLEPAHFDDINKEVSTLG